MTKKKKLMIGVLAGLSIFTTTTVVLASSNDEGDVAPKQTQSYKQEEQTGRYGNMMEDNREYGQDRQTTGDNNHCHGRRAGRRQARHQGSSHNQTFRHQGRMSQN